jgi:uncharacterized protein YjbI with pentapeptide repeats
MREELYYNAQTLATSFTEKPGPNLSVPRLIKGQPAFCHQGLEDQKKPKKIVVTHPLKAENDIKKLIFTLQLMTLRQEGFEVFLQSGNELIPFKTITDIEGNLQSISKISGEKKKVSDYASQLNCSGDEIYLLDDSKIAPIIEYGAKQWEHYRVNEGTLSLNISPLQFEGFNQLIQRHVTEIKSLSLGYCPYLIKNAGNQNIVCDSLPTLEELDIDLTSTPESDMLNIALILDIIQKSPNLKTFKLKLPKHVSNEDWQSFKQMLAKVLEKKGIENIEIFNNCPMEFFIDDTQNNLTQLKVINIRGEVYFHPELYLKIFRAENLTSFSGWVLNFDNIESYNLTKLEELVIAIPDNTTSESLNKLLEKTPKLKKLNLCYETNISALFDTVIQPHLEELSLSATSITSKSLVSLLTNTPNLKKLDLSDCQNITGSIEHVNLPNLEELNLKGTSITSDSLNNLLAKTPKLKKLDLSICQKITGSIESDDLSSLEELYLNNSVITSKSLNNLLANTPKLKKLNLSYCQYIADAITNVHLPNLEELNLSRSNINDTELAHLLTSATHLKQLYLDNCSLIALPESITFQDLEYLDLSGASLNIESLIKLIERTPNLKRVKIA